MSNPYNIYISNYNGELIQLKQIFKRLAWVLEPEISIIVVINWDTCYQLSHYPKCYPLWYNGQNDDFTPYRSRFQSSTRLSVMEFPCSEKNVRIGLVM